MGTVAIRRTVRIDTHSQALDRVHDMLPGHEVSDRPADRRIVVVDVGAAVAVAGHNPVVVVFRVRMGVGVAGTDDVVRQQFARAGVTALFQATIGTGVVVVIDLVVGRAFYRLPSSADLCSNPQEANLIRRSRWLGYGC